MYFNLSAQRIGASAAETTPPTSQSYARDATAWRGRLQARVERRRNQSPPTNSQPIEQHITTLLEQHNHPPSQLLKTTHTLIRRRKRKPPILIPVILARGQPNELTQELRLIPTMHKPMIRHVIPRPKPLSTPTTPPRTQGQQTLALTRLRSNPKLNRKPTTNNRREHEAHNLNPGIPQPLKMRKRTPKPTLTQKPAHDRAQSRPHRLAFLCASHPQSAQRHGASAAEHRATTKL
jgi:hypothetical protein